MTDIRINVVVITVLCGATAFATAGEPKLANAKRVFAGAQPVYKRPRQYTAFTMRITPDGTRLLYSRRTAETEQADNRNARYEVVLRDLASGKETVLAIDPVDENIFSQWSFFDPAGKRLAIPTFSRTTVTWSVYDIAALMAATGEPKPLVSGIEGSLGPAKFTADSKSLITSVANMEKRQMEARLVSLADPNAKPTALSAEGWLQSVCPAGGLAVFFVPPGRLAGPPQPGQPWQRPPIRLVLWDLKADKELALLPTHPRNSVLDDWETQWTSDGRYLYYYDVEEETGEGQDRPSLRAVTRVWDAKSGSQAATIRDAIPVGPGPGAATMVLAKRTLGDSGGILIHDAASGKEYILGGSDKKLIHAFAGKVVYAEKQAGADEEVVFVADIIAPEEGK